MPRLASNRDVNEQENWSGLIAAGLVVGAAVVAGGVIGASKNTKSMLKNYDKEDVVNGLYGGKAKYFKTNNKGWDDVVERNFVKHGENLDPNARRYQAGRSTTGKAKMYRTDGNVFQNAWANWTDKDLKIFNKELRDIQKNVGEDSIYAQSKLSLYSDLEGASKTLNTNTNELNKLTDNIYNSKKMANVREAKKITGTAADVDVTNSIWGDMYTENPKMNYKQYNKQQEKEARKKATGTLKDFTHTQGDEITQVFNSNASSGIDDYGQSFGSSNGFYGQGASYYNAPQNSTSVSSKNKPNRKSKKMDQRQSQKAGQIQVATPQPSVPVTTNSNVRSGPGQLRNKLNETMSRPETVRRQEAQRQSGIIENAKQNQIKKQKAPNIYNSAVPDVPQVAVKKKANKAPAPYFREPAAPQSYSSKTKGQPNSDKLVVPLQMNTPVPQQTSTEALPFNPPKVKVKKLEKVALPELSPFSHDVFSSKRIQDITDEGKTIPKVFK